jgi:hypothetical protein
MFNSSSDHLFWFFCLPPSNSTIKSTMFFLVGEVINEKDKCGQCKGQKVVQDKKVLEVYVEKGMQHGQKITFEGEADEAVRCSFYSYSNVLH